MKQAGYSGTPLILKLGYQPTDTVYLLDAPDTFQTYLIASNAKLVKQLPADWLQVFCKTKLEFTTALQNNKLDQITTGCWLCWPKHSSGSQIDLTEQDFRNALLPLGWVDTKVCAIDDTWSALKFVRRKIAKS